jgi:hypothetical protein
MTKQRRAMNRVVPMGSLVEAVYDAGLEPDGVIRNDYSGRGMYGERCFGLKVDSLSEAVEVMVSLALEDQDFSVKSLASSMCLDNMGMGYICYFPGWTTDAEEAEDDEEEDEG